MIFVAQIALFTIFALLSFVFKIVLHYETTLQLFIFKKMIRVYILLFITITAVQGMDAPIAFYDRLSAIVEERIADKKDLNGLTGRLLCEPIRGDYMGNETPLYASTSSDQYLPITKRLLKNGADVNFSPSDWSRVPLFHAIDLLAIKTARVLLRAGADPSQKTEGNQRTLLHRVCNYISVCNKPHIKENKKIVRLLLKYGANPNAQHDSGFSPLYELCFTDEKAQPIIILLLLYGADISLKDESGRDVIALAEYMISKYGIARGSRVGLVFLKDWRDGKIKLKKKKIK